MLVGNYSVYYLADRNTNSVNVIRILYAGRDVERIISEEE